MGLNRFLLLCSCRGDQLVLSFDLDCTHLVVVNLRSWFLRPLACEHMRQLIYQFVELREDAADRQRPEPFAAALRAAKAAVDPAGVLNPGVLVDPVDPTTDID